jgi:hypothetical protein
MLPGVFLKNCLSCHKYSGVTCGFLITLVFNFFHLGDLNASGRTFQNCRLVFFCATQILELYQKDMDGGGAGCGEGRGKEGQPIDILVFYCFTLIALFPNL